MLNLASTSDKLQLVTSAAGDVDVHASWVDLAGSTVTPGRTITAAIATATTTDIVPAPGASTVRNIKTLTVNNTSGSVANAVEVHVTDGTNDVEVRACTLLPGETLLWSESSGWVHYDATGAEYLYSNALDPWAAYSIAGGLAESVPRSLAGVNISALTSGTLLMQGIYLRAGQLVSAISFHSATTGVTSPTNRFHALYDGSRNLLAQSANQTTGAWAANTIQTLAMTTPYRITASGLYYAALMVAATTVPTLAGVTASANAAIRGQSPILAGNSSTGLTTSLPNPGAAITASVNTVWAAVT